MYQCPQGHEHPDEHVENWGRDGIGDGYGPQPVCTELVEDPRTGGLEACQRPLHYVAEAQPEE